MKGRGLFVAAVVLSAAVALSACGYSGIVTDNATPTPDAPSVTIAPMQTAKPDTGPVYGGTINLSMRNPKTLNPLLNEDETVDGVLSLIFEKLAVLDSSLRPVPNPALLVSIDLSTDTLSVLLTLREEAVWSDGTPVTAKDVAYSVDVLKSAPERAIYRTVSDNISSVNIIDEKTVKFNLIQPVGQMTYFLCFPIVPEHYYKGANQEKQMKPLGNGVYVFSEHVPARRLGLTVSELSLRGEPFIENVNVVFIADAEGDFHAFEQGITDAAVFSVAEWGRLRGVAEVKAADFTSGYFDFIGFNFDDPVLGEKLFRQAVARCVPYNDILDRVYLGFANLSMTPVHPVSWLHDKSAAQPAFNTDAAADMFASVDLRGDGGQPRVFKILVNEENNERVRIAELLRENMVKAGVLAEVVAVSFDEFTDMLDRREFEIFIGGYNLGVTPDFTFMLGSAEDNIFHYRDSVMDFLLKNAAATSGEFNSARAFGELQRYIADEMPLVGIAFRKSVLLARNGVAGNILPECNNIFANIEKWYIIK